jgi:Flp pilus assembly protein TadG
MRPAIIRQRGAVALELALTLPVLLVVLVYLLFYSRVLYSYEVAQKATRDGVRYLSAVPALNMRNPALATQEANLAQAIAQQQLGALSAAGGGIPVYVACNGIPCSAMNGSVPSTVTVTVVIQVNNEFYGYGGGLGGQQLQVSHSMRYVGN